MSLLLLLLMREQVNISFFKYIRTLVLFFLYDNLLLLKKSSNFFPYYI
jgi:hypothetical protein